ncbi:MAG: hypothetical protein JSR89_01645 [Proteobacteria bacterium]|nr:hypothetical protein [Pseudomonadota bacterium]
MKFSYLAIGAASALLALSGAANAHSSSAGGGGAPSVPPGFSSGGNHTGFDSNSTGSTPSSSPRGWDQGKADWKTNSPDGQASGGTPAPADSALAPGFAHH